MTIPLDGGSLTLIEEALNGSYNVDEDGNHTLVGSQFTLPQLLDFWAGTNRAAGIEIAPGVVDMTSQASLTRDDLIRALIDEVRRLRRGR